jgi:hypothetical protein
VAHNPAGDLGVRPVVAALQASAACGTSAPRVPAQLAA